MLFFAENLFGSADFATFFEAIELPRSQKLAAVSKFLDVTPSTINAWLTHKRTPPRAAVIALFHECPYGLSATSSHSEQAVLLQRGVNNSLRSENEKLRAAIQTMQTELATIKRSGTHPAAMNDPDYLRGIVI